MRAATSIAWLALLLYMLLDGRVVLVGPHASPAAARAAVAANRSISYTIVVLTVASIAWIVFPRDARRSSRPASPRRAVIGAPRGSTRFTASFVRFCRESRVPCVDVSLSPRLGGRRGTTRKGFRPRQRCDNISRVPLSFTAATRFGDAT